MDSMLTYICDGKHHSAYDLAAYNHIDIVDCLPCRYDRKILQRLGCTRPLYLSNEISILSTVDRIDEYDSTSMLKVYNWDTWITFMITLIVLISISSVKTTLRHSFWSFIDPLFGKDNPHAVKGLTYALYLLAIIPFIEIMRNELLVKLVTVKEKSCDTIDDLMDPRVKVFSFIDMDYLNQVNKNIEDARLRQKLDKLFKKIGKSTGLSDWLELIQEHGEIKKFGRNYAMIENEYQLIQIQVCKRALVILFKIKLSFICLKLFYLKPSKLEII